VGQQNALCASFRSLEQQRGRLMRPRRPQPTNGV